MTDSDRYAGVIDKRFKKLIFRITQRTRDAVGAVCDYLDRRDREAAPTLAKTYDLAERLLQRRALLLLADNDPQIGALEAQGRESFPATRLVAAFRDANESGEDLADTYALHRFRWLVGAVTAEDEVADLAPTLGEMGSEIVRELAERHREKLLGIPRTTVVPPIFSGDVLHEPIPLREP